MAQERYRLDQEIDVLGKFYLPSEKAPNEVFGRLRFSPQDGFLLELMGQLDPDDLMIFRTGSIPIIEGRLRDGKYIRLIENSSGGSSVDLMTGTGYESYRPFSALISKTPICEETTSSLSIHFDGLELWLGSVFAENKLNPNKSNNVLADISILAPDDHEIPVPCISATVKTGYDIQIPGETRTEVSATYAAYIRLVTTEAQSLGWFSEMGRRLRHLACLCCGITLPLRAVQFVVAQREQNGIPIEDWGSVVNLQERIEWNEKLLPRFAVFDIKQLIRLQPEFMEKWFLLYERLKQPLDIFFALQRNRYPYIESQFLAIVQAVESYDRISRSAEFTDHAELEELKDEILNGLPARTNDAIRSRIAGALMMANEPSLRDRIKHCVAKLTPAFGEHPFGLCSNFISRIVETRNYLTHAGKRNSKLLNLSDMLEATYRLRSMLAVIIFTDLGLDQNTINRRIVFTESFYGRHFNHS